MTTAFADCDQIKQEYWRERPAPMPMVAFARTLTTPDSEDERGNLEPYAPESHAGQLIVLRAMDGFYDRPGHHFRTFILIGDAQGAGKSWLLQITAFHTMVERGQNIIYALPTRDLAGDVWSLKLQPAFKGAGLAVYLPKEGPGSKSGSKPRFISLRRVNKKGGGGLVFMGAGGRGQSGQASLTAKKIIVDEVDDWTRRALALIKKRISKFNQTAQQYYACTINRNNSKDKEGDESNIVPLYNASIMGRIGYPCPKCTKITTFQPLKFTYSGTTEDEWKASARVACDHCAHPITEEDRTTLLTHGELVMGKPDRGDFGLLMNALDCPWKPLHWLAGLDHAARVALDQGDDEQMRQLYNKEWSLQYTRLDSDKPPAIDAESLLRRSEASTWGPTVTDNDRDGQDQRSFSCHIAESPPGAEWSVRAIDVQADRCYWLMMCGDKDGRTWDKAWGYEYFDKERKPFTWQQLHAVLDRIDGITRNIAGEVPIKMSGIDTNFDTEHILDWLASHFEWLPLYGASAKKAARMQRSGYKIKDYPGIMYRRRTDGWKLTQDRCHIDTTPMRMLAQRAFLLEIGAPGAAHLPSGLRNNTSDMSYLWHLCAEMWDETTMTWKHPKGAGRWDYLDLRTYCTAMHKILMIEAAKPVEPDPVPQSHQPQGWLDGFTGEGPWLK